MDENWTCLGEVRNQCASNLLSVRPLAAAVLASGWVKRCAPEALQPSAFVVVSLEKTFNLLCSLSEACLVAASLDAGYDVWVTGVLLITRRTSIINFEGCSVWRTSANAPLVIPAMIAKSLWHSARATAIDQAFSVRPIEDIEQRTLIPSLTNRFLCTSRSPKVAQQIPRKLAAPCGRRIPRPVCGRECLA
jgi:hypothetical protein